MTNRLFYGDNLAVLRQSVDSESVDLVYLDPPFNSNRAYNIIFRRHDVVAADDVSAQIQAFDDTWRWTPVTDEQFKEYTGGGLPNAVSDALTAFRTLLGENDAMAYLVNMAPRLVELHRVLKPTGSLYLHCDQTMSHYLKVLLDAIFGPAAFGNEIIWKRGHGHNSANRYGRNHDVILYYRRSELATWNAVFQAYDEDYTDKHYKHIDPANGRRYKRENPSGAGTRNGATGEPWRGINPTAKGRHWAKTPAEMDALDAAGKIYWPKKAGAWPYLKLYLDEMPGVPCQGLWIDIDVINMQAAERLGYPTQKPLALLERIITASSNLGDVVLDPFCGCGTTIDAAQKLGRGWIGIDVTYLSVDLVEKRLLHAYGAEIAATYVKAGIPRDKEAAFALFSKSPLEFERWAVSLLNGQPNERQSGDKGIDGVARFPLGGAGGRLVKGKQKKAELGGIGRILVSVKGGKIVGPQFVRDLIGTVETQKAELGVLITMAAQTRGVRDAVDHGGTYTHPGSQQKFSRVQVISVADLLTGKRPNLPLTQNPYIEARKTVASEQTAELF